jgi:hypothetical protein
MQFVYVVNISFNILVNKTTRQKNYNKANILLLRMMLDFQCVT